MCGIAGALSFRSEPIANLEDQLAQMNGLLSHRGPDGEGMWVHQGDHVGFSHRRLSIIDLATGEQPMCDPGGNWVTYNGEIYNYLELREEIGPENFATTSDTEVILHSYRKWDGNESIVSAVCSPLPFGMRRKGPCSAPEIASESSRSTTLSLGMFSTLPPK